MQKTQVIMEQLVENHTLAIQGVLISLMYWPALDIPPM